MIKKIVIEALTEFFSSSAGKELVKQAVNDALIYDIKSEKTLPDGRVEIIEEKRHALAAMITYLSRTEGAIRGCQEDAAAARNKAVQTRELVLRMAEKLSEYSQIIKSDGWNVRLEKENIMELEDVDN
jgi:hypothetical protein